MCIVFPGVYHFLSVLAGTTSVKWPLLGCRVPLHSVSNYCDALVHLTSGFAWNLFVALHMATGSKGFTFWSIKIIKTRDCGHVQWYDMDYCCYPQDTHRLDRGKTDLFLWNIFKTRVWLQDWFTHLGDFNLRDDADSFTMQNACFCNAHRRFTVNKPQYIKFVKVPVILINPRPQ